MVDTVASAICLGEGKWRGLGGLPGFNTWKYWSGKMSLHILLWKKTKQKNFECEEK